MHSLIDRLDISDFATAQLRRGDDPGGPLATLIAALDRAGIRYCHWKSNVRLPETLAGGEDIDLLVIEGTRRRSPRRSPERGSSSRTRRPTLATPASSTPSPSTHLPVVWCICTATSRSYPVTVWSRATDCHSRTRCWPDRADPWACPCLRQRWSLPSSRFGSPKHTSATEIVMANRGYEAVVGELAWLEAAADRAGAAALWRGWLPAADVGLFDRTLAAIADRRAILRRIAVGREVAREARRWRRLRPTATLCSRWRRVALMAVGRFRRQRDLVLQTGGLVVALVGPKGTGKSTLGGALSTCLGEHLRVRRVHAGKPPPTAMTFMPRIATPLARRLFPRERPGEYEKPERRRRESYSLIYVFRMMLLAHDRRALLQRCWRAAAAGAIVVTDRYPSETVGAIDSRCFDDATIAACRSPLKRWMMRRERALCADVPPSGLVIRLAAPAATAVRRDAERIKVDGPDADAVLRRWEMETCGEFGRAPVVVVDTDRPLPETVANVTEPSGNCSESLCGKSLREVEQRPPA
jgi:hypothetical protein